MDVKTTLLLTGAALALLIGGAYMIVKKVISPKIPLTYIGTFAVFVFLFGGFDISYTLNQICAGGLVFGAFFMATDYVTTPKTTLGNIIYFIALGLFTAGLRKATGIEVVSFCILLMNFLVFLIDLAIKPRPFGYVRRKKIKEANK